MSETGADAAPAVEALADDRIPDTCQEEGHSDVEMHDDTSRHSSQLTAESKSSQESKAIGSPERSRSTSASQSSGSTRSGSTLKPSQSVRNDDESSCSSLSTMRLSQSTASHSDDEEQSSSSFKSKKSSPDKSQNQDKSSQSTRTDLTEDSDSRSSATSSRSKSTVKNSQTVADHSDDESNSRSSFVSSNKSASQKHSQKSVAEYSDEEGNSRSSFKSKDKDISPKKNCNNDTSMIKDITVKDILDNENSTESNSNSPRKFDKPKKYFSIVDSDSDDDIVNKKLLNNEKSDNSDSEANNDSPVKKPDKKPNVNIKKLLDSDSDEDKSDNDSGKENMKSTNKSNKISNIVDSDSESDHCSDQEKNVSEDEENTKSKKGKEKPEKKRKGSARASKDAAMQHIHSETQRLIRESHVSLPYHRPKQRTLQEFLNRKKISSTIPQNLTSAAKVKMFPEVISKVVEEKEKEAEMFFKSSDSEDEEENNKPMETELVVIKDDKTVNQSVAENVNLNISNTQKSTQENIQNSHNKISSLQQRSLDFGVPRKLFPEDETVSKSTEDMKVSEFLKEKENLSSNNLEKLFDDDSESMDVCNDTEVNITPTLEKENSKVEENAIKDTSESENKTTHESSTEEFELQMSETEQITCNNEDSKIDKTNEEFSENKNAEKIILENPIVNNKNLTTAKDVESNSDDLFSKSSKVSEEPILELSEKINDDDIIDKNMLKDDFFMPPELDEPAKKFNIKRKILANALKMNPTIKALPGSIIDFTSSEQLKNGVSKLMDRFTRHSVIRKPIVPSVTEVKVLRTEGSGNDINVIEEVLSFKKSIVEDDGKKESKPGEKLKKLKEDLKRKIATVRNEEWKQKKDNEKEDEEDVDEKGKGDDFYADLPDEEDLLDDEESAESEPEEDDVPMIDKKRSNCEFGDDEAEESLDEGDGAKKNDIEEEEDEENDEEDDEEEESESEEEEEIDKEPKKLKRIIKPADDDSSDSDTNEKNETDTKLSLERTKTDEDMFPSQIKSNFVLEDMESESIPAFIRERLGSDARSQACKTPLPRSNMVLSMISPINHLTVLNSSMDSAKKSGTKTPNFDLGKISTDNTPLENSNRPPNNCSLEKMMSLQKKLFEDPPEAVDDQELLEICSGKFVDTQDEIEPPANKLANINEVTDSQIMDVCSGSFMSQVNDSRKLEDTVPIGDETSQDIKLTLDDEEESKSPAKTSYSFKPSDESMFSSDSKSSSKSPSKISTSLKPSDESMFSSDSKSPVKSISKSPVKFKSPIKSAFKCKNPMEAWLKKASEKAASTQIAAKPLNDVTDSQILDVCSGAFMSQPIDVKELEKDAVGIEKSQNLQSLDDKSLSPFTKVLESKNDSKSKKNADKKDDDEEEEESNAPWVGFAIASSSDEDNKESKNQKTKRKKKVLKKKKVQKLNLSDDEEEEHNEFSDLEESEVEEYEEEEEKYIDYDSDENEIVVVPKKEIKKVASKFLEDEAELSGSECGSDDEDEEDLDKLEFEEGDVEDIDEDKMKDELGKLHMKQVMDEDQRDVRLLQELLFDDGDLHSEGAGRERKFRWKNIDSLGEDDNTESKPDDNADEIDDEIDTTVEVEMRKMRYEQQKFREEKQKISGKVIDDDFSESEIFKIGVKVVSVRSSSKTVDEEKKIGRSISDSSKNINFNGASNVASKKLITSTKSLSFSNMRGSFLARGDETLIRIAQNLPETTKVALNTGRKRKFVFEHLSPTVNNSAIEDLEHENESTPVNDAKKRKTKMFASQTPTSTKKLRMDNPKAGKKLF